VRAHRRRDGKGGKRFVVSGVIPALYEATGKGSEEERGGQRVTAGVYGNRGTK